MYSMNAEYVCYDDGCHLRKFCQNPVRRELTETTKILAATKIVVDKMHILGHVDAWCLENCDSRKIKDLDKVTINYFWKYLYITSYPGGYTDL